VIIHLDITDFVVSVGIVIASKDVSSTITNDDAVIPIIGMVVATITGSTVTVVDCLDRKGYRDIAAIVDIKKTKSTENEVNSSLQEEARISKD
jgi:uncharacterized protein (DUF362 family)